MRFCSKCGTAAEDADRFCSNCGAELKAPAKSSGRSARSTSATEAAAPSTPSGAVAQNRAAPPQRRARGKVGLKFWTVVIAVGWLFYSSGLLGVVTGAYRYDSQSIERAMGNADWISFGLMIGLPIVIAILQPVLDIVLIPLQLIKALLPVKLVIGIGMAAPFAVAWVLYDVWGFRNYPFLHYSLFFGMLITYAILRTPKRFSA